MHITKGCSKGRLHLHTFMLKSVPHSYHFFLLYGYVLAVCRTKIKTFKERNVYIILHNHNELVLLHVCNK